MSIHRPDTGELRKTVDSIKKRRKQKQSSDQPETESSSSSSSPSETKSPPQPSQPSSAENKPQFKSSDQPQPLSELSTPSQPEEKPSSTSKAPLPQPPSETAPPPSLEESGVEKPSPSSAGQESQTSQSPRAGEKFKSVLNKAQKEGQSISLEQDADSFDLDTMDALLTRLDKEDLQDPQKVEDLLYTLLGQEIIKLKNKEGRQYGRYFLEFVQNKIDEGKYKISQELASDFSPEAKQKKDANPVLWLINQKRKEFVEKKKTAQGKTQNAYYNKAIAQIETLGRTLILEK